MSRFLKSRKIWILAIGIVLVAVLIMCNCWVSAIALLLAEALLLLAFWVEREALLPRQDLQSNRRIKRIDTLVIGDWCSRKVLSQRFDLKHALVVRAPGRSEKASLLLLEHLASRLDGKNVCIVAPRSDKGKIGEYDIPFLSQVTRLELGLREEPLKRLTYLLRHPSVLLRTLLSPFEGLKETAPKNEALLQYCERKGYNLCYLIK